MTVGFSDSYTLQLLRMAVWYCLCSQGSCEILSDTLGDWLYLVSMLWRVGTYNALHLDETRLKLILYYMYQCKVLILTGTGQKADHHLPWFVQQSVVSGWKVFKFPWTPGSNSNKSCGMCICFRRRMSRRLRSSMLNPF